MKNIIFIIFLFPLTAFAQLGIKSGYIQKGFQTGLTYHYQFSESKIAYFEAEVLYNSTRTKGQGGYVVDNNGLIRNVETTIIKHGVSLPLSLKIQGNKTVRPFLRWGLNPTVYKDQTLDFLIGSGLKIDRFLIEGRYLLPLTYKEDGTIHVSITCYLWKNRKALY